jgi:RNA-directed DNA polymerase
MTKAGITLQGLQDNIEIRATSAPEHRFWGLHVHIKKMDVLRTAYLVASAKRAALSVDGVTFHQTEESGRDAFLAETKQSLDEAYSPGRYRKVDNTKGDGTRHNIFTQTIRDKVVRGSLSPLR